MTDPCNATAPPANPHLPFRARLRPAAGPAHGPAMPHSNRFDRLAPSATAVNLHLLLCIVEPRDATVVVWPSRRLRVNRQRSRAFAVTVGPERLRAGRSSRPDRLQRRPGVADRVQQPAVNGTNAMAWRSRSGVALRNVHLRAPQSVDYVPSGSDVGPAVRGGQRITDAPDAWCPSRPTSARWRHREPDAAAWRHVW